MKNRLQQIGPLLSSLGIGGCFRYLALGALADAGEISRFRSTRVALGEIDSPMETVRNASLLALKDLLSSVETVTVLGKHACIRATIGEMDLFIRLKRIAPKTTRIAVDVARPTSMGQIVADTVLELTCRLVREMGGTKTHQQQGKRPIRPADNTYVIGNLIGVERRETA
ncbi:MAG: hypothetical protein JEZ11_00500 [Desulfobacterales bacterium]|nr:hypothetical protein [Desulfobacterales bacterium]